MPASQLYDYTLTIASGSNAGTYGFMLVSPPGQSKTLDTVEAPGPAAQRISTNDVATHQDFDPRVDTPFSMGDFSGGCGQLEWDNADDTMYWWGVGVTHVPGKVYAPPPASTLAVGAETTVMGDIRTYVSPAGNRYDWCFTGTKLYRRDASNNTNAWGLFFTASDTITDFKVFNNVGLVAIPGNAGATDFHGVTGTVDTLGGAASATNYNHTAFAVGTRPKLFVPLRGTCFAVADNGKVFYSVSPLTDSWAGPINATVAAVSSPNVGELSYPFTNAVAVNDYLFTFNWSGGHSIDSQQNVTEVFWQRKDKPAAENYKYVVSTGDALAYSQGPEVFTYDPGTGANLRLNLSKQSGFSVQQIFGIGSDNQYIYVLAQVYVPKLRSAASIAVLRCWRRSASRWGYEVLWEDTSIGTKIYGRLGVVPVGFGSRLYWGYQSAAGATLNTYIMYVPADWDETSSGTYNAAAEIVTSISRSGFPGFSKRHLWMNLETEGVDHSGTPSVAVSYSTDNGANFSSLGNTSTGSSQSTRLSFSNVHSKSLAYKFTLTATSGVTPVIRVFDSHSRVRFRYLPSSQLGTRVASNVERLNGTRDTRTAAQVLADIEKCRTEEGDITYADFLGRSFKVSVDSLSYRPTRHEKPDAHFEIEALVGITRADAGA